MKLNINMVFMFRTGEVLITTIWCRQFWQCETMLKVGPSGDLVMEGGKRDVDTAISATRFDRLSYL